MDGEGEEVSETESALKVGASGSDPEMDQCPGHGRFDGLVHGWIG